MKRIILTFQVCKIHVSKIVAFVSFEIEIPRVPFDVFIRFFFQTFSKCPVFGTRQGAGRIRQSFCRYGANGFACAVFFCIISSLYFAAYFSISPFSYLLCFRSINYFKSMSSFQVTFFSHLNIQ